MKSTKNLWLQNPMQLLSLLGERHAVQACKSYCGGMHNPPRTEVVHLEDTAPQHPAVVGAIGLVHVWFALAADASRTIVLGFKGLQLRKEGANLTVFSTNDPRVRNASRLREYSTYHADETKG
eukprot:3573419-Prymnesium_polylepis.1